MEAGKPNNDTLSRAKRSRAKKKNPTTFHEFELIISNIYKNNDKFQKAFKKDRETKAMLRTIPKEYTSGQNEKLELVRVKSNYTKMNYSMNRILNDDVSLKPKIVGKPWAKVGEKTIKPSIFVKKTFEHFKKISPEPPKTAASYHERLQKFDTFMSFHRVYQNKSFKYDKISQESIEEIEQSKLQLKDVMNDKSIQRIMYEKSLNFDEKSKTTSISNSQTKMGIFPRPKPPKPYEPVAYPYQRKPRVQNNQNQNQPKVFAPIPVSKRIEQILLGNTRMNNLTKKSSPIVVQNQNQKRTNGNNFFKIKTLTRKSINFSFKNQIDQKIKNHVKFNL